MNRKIVLLTIAIMVLPGLMVGAVNADEEDEGPGSRQTVQDMKKWTFIVFLFSDSSQHGGSLPSYYSMIKNMETKGGWSDENVNVLVLQDRHPVHAPDKDGDTHAFFVKEGEGNSQEIALNEIHFEWTNEVNMGSRYTLKHFGEYAITHYPADHYVLITRSAGWWPDNFGEDETSGDNMNPFEMRSVVADLSKVAGKKIDVLNIAGCTSGMFEWAYDYYPFVDYYVGVETYSIGSNWRIYYWIKDLRKDPDMSVADFTKIIVDEYVNEDRSGYNPYNTLTASSTDLSKIKATGDGLDRLSLALMEDMRENIHRIWMARDKTAEIDNYLRVDTWEFAYQISEHFPKGSKVHDAAIEVMELFEDMIVHNRWHSGIEGYGINVSTAKGLCLYFVKDREVHEWNAVDAYRSRLHFTLETHWVDFLDEYFSYYHEKVALATGDAFMEVFGTGADLDGDHQADDIWVEVWSNVGEPLRDVSIYINGDFWGKTNEEGWFAEFNLHEGDYIVTAIYNTFSATIGIHCDGAGPGYQIILDAHGLDLDGDGWNDDLYVWLHDNYGQPIPWALLYSEGGWIGWTRENGEFWGFDYKEGSHLVMAQVWEQFFAVDQFYSEGQGDEQLLLDPRVIDYSNDGEVNDLDLRVNDFHDEGLDGAIVYVDDEYLGETFDGRILDLDMPEGWHWTDVYYKEAKVTKDAYFKDVYVRYADLNNDSLVETLSVYYDVEVKEAAMDVKVTEQVFLWNTGEIRGVFYDNYTAVRGVTDHHLINYTTDRTRFVNITLTLMDEDGYMMDRWEMTGFWLEAAQNEPPEARLFARPTYTYVDDTVTLNATTSTDIDGNITQYFFDFGDGTNSGWTNVSVIEHVYNEPGNYTTYVMVIDDLGAMDDQSNRITIWVREGVANIEPKARLFVRPTYTYPWEVVSLNGTTSEDEDGEIVSYMFNFGDGTVSGWTNSSMVEHIYNMPGNYTVKLKVLDDHGAESDWSNKITVWVREHEGNSPPHAYFTARPSRVNVNETVTFNASGSEDEDGNVYKYFFDFGDGTNSGWVYEPIITHAYSEPGYYTTMLMVEDDLEAMSEWSTPRGIAVEGNVIPRPYLFARPHYIDIGEEVTFNASQSWDEDGKVVLYLFDFGDGTTSGWTSEPVLVHSYEKAGNYTIILYVQDDKGGISTSMSRSTVTVQTVEEVPLVESPYLTAVVIAIFVALMIAGSWYELKKVRLKSYEAPGTEGPIGPVTDEEEEEEDKEPPGPPPEEKKDLDSRSVGAELDAHDEAEVEEKVEVEKAEPGPPPRTKKELPSKSMHGEIDTDDEHARARKMKRHQAGYIRVRCSGCGGTVKAKKGPRPIRLKCSNCGKKGVLR